MLVYQERKPKGALEIKQAESSRGSKVESYENLRQSLSKLTGRDPELEQILSLINAKNDQHLCSLIFAAWHEAKNINVPLAMLNVHSTDHMTDDQLALYQAVKAIDYNNKSADPSRYWDKKEKKFVPLPLTDEEKELILERNKLYIKSEEEGKVYEFVKMFTELFNLSAMNHQVKITPAEFRGLMPWLHPLVRIKGAQPRPQEPGYQKDVVFILEVREELFFRNELKGKLVFDE